MENHHIRSITWVSFLFFPLIRILVQHPRRARNAYELSITRSSSSCPRTALSILFMVFEDRAESRNCRHELPWARITEITGHEAGWLPSFTQQPTSFHRCFIVRLDLVTWAWRNASYLLFCVSTFRDLDAADRSRREQW